MLVGFVAKGQIAWNIHWVKGARIQNFSGLYFSAFRLNREIYSVNLRI